MHDQLILGNIRPNTKIFRIFRQDRFFDLFEKQENTLVKPSKWEDPFENVFLRSPVILPNGERTEFDFHDEVFGQCWTLERSSDAMWRIYSKSNDAIRVRTSVGTLIESLASVHGKFSSARCFIGRVNYETQKGLREFGKNMFKLYPVAAEAIAQSLLIKRNAYKHENEVRMIYIASKEEAQLGSIYKYRIDPITLVNQVMVDGRIPQNKFRELKEKIAYRTGLSKRRIHRSRLYDPPRNFIVHSI